MKPVVTLGECMGLFRANWMGSITPVYDFTLGIRGAGGNVAVALARLGTLVRWLGRFGADPIGRRVLGESCAEGIDVIGIVDPEASTGIMVKEQRTVDATLVHYHRAGSAGSHLSVTDLPAADISNAALCTSPALLPLFRRPPATRCSRRWRSDRRRCPGIFRH